MSTYESSVATDEVVHSLGQAQLAHRWKNAKRITGEKDHILWMGTDTWDLSVGDVLYRICCPSVLCNNKKTNFDMNHHLSVGFREGASCY